MKELLAILAGVFILSSLKEKESNGLKGQKTKNKKNISYKNDKFTI